MYIYVYIIYGVSLRIYKDKTVKSCFCLEGIVYIKFSKNRSLIKLYHMSNILDFLCESIVVNKIVNIVIFFYISWNYLSLWNYLSIHSSSFSFEFFHQCFFCNFSANNTPPFIVLYHKPDLPTRLFLILPFSHSCKMVRYVLWLEVGKVLVFFIVNLNNNSHSPVKVFSLKVLCW